MTSDEFAVLDTIHAAERLPSFQELVRRLLGDPSTITAGVLAWAERTARTHQGPDIDDDTLSAIMADARTAFPECGWAFYIFTCALAGAPLAPFLSGHPEVPDAGAILRGG